MEIKIQNYTLTRLEPQAMDIEINFEQPDKLASVASDPDLLRVKFINNNMFMDYDELRLDNELQIQIPI